VTATNAWKTLALLGGAMLASCYGSSGQTKDGQSHWLEVCSTAVDCADDQLCVCGVCTIECQVNTACGASSTCENVSQRRACEGAPPAVTQVCLASCDEDEDCAPSSLRCENASCVMALESMPDPIVEAGVNPDSGDDSGTDAAIVVDAAIDPNTVATVEGRLTCSEVEQRRSAALSDLASEHSECETERDCICASASTECSPECEQPVSLLTINAFLQTVRDFNDDYCLDPNFHGPCGHIDIDCSSCQTVCVAGECELTNRARCSITGLACPDDLICHVDYTCLGRGVDDDNGVTTLAIARELELMEPWFFGISAFAVTTDAIYWLDAGTFDNTSTHLDDGILYRMALDDDMPEVLASELGLGMKGMTFDATSLYYTTIDGIWSVPLAGGAAPTLLVDRADFEPPPWILHDGFIYYVNNPDGFVHRVRVDGSLDERFWSNVDPVRGLAASGDVVYVEVKPPGELYSALVGFTAPETTPVLNEQSFRTDPDTGPLLVDDGRVLADYGEENGLQVYTLSSMMHRTIAADAWLEQRFASGGFVYSLEYADSGMSDSAHYYITRTAIGDDQSERLRRAVAPVGHIAVAGDYLYWVEELRLMRKAL
jgi:hypothetical protein